jgi:hypothetical protein
VTKVGLGAIDDDAIRPLWLDPHLVAWLQPGSPKALDRQGHLMLGGDSRHAFTLT